MTNNKLLLSITSLIFVVLTACSSPSQTEQVQSQPGQLVLTDEQSRYPLGGYIDILEDPTGELTIEQVASPEYSGNFVSRLGTNFNLTRSAYWVRLKVVNQASSSNEWLLVMSDSRMQYIDLFIPSPDGTGFSEKQTGALRPFSTRDFPHNQFVFILSLPSDSEQTIFLRFQSHLAITFPMTIWSWEAFSSTQFTGKLKSGFWYGAVIVLMGYNFLLLLSLREISYLYYVLFLGSALGSQAIFEGIAAQYLWRQNMIPNEIITVVFNSLMILFALKFTDTFLLRQVRVRWLTWLNNAIMIGWAAVILLGGVFTTFYAFNFNLLAVLSSILIILAGIVAFQHGYRQSRYYLVAWPGFFLPFGMARLVRLGVLPTDFILPDLHFGLIWLGLFWALALADHINLLKAKTEAANKEIAQKESDLHQYLEAMPVGVTIYDANGKLKYINQTARQMLSNPERDIQPDVTSERTIDQAVEIYSFHIAGTEASYPLDRLLLIQALRGKSSYANDIEVDLIDKRVPLEAWASPVFSEDGDVQFAIATFQDITQRKRFEESLRESQARLSGILDIAADAIISFDENQEIILFNQAAEATFGYRSKEVIGKSPDILIPERFIAAHREQIQDFGLSANAHFFLANGLTFYMRNNGEEFPVEGSISKLELGGGKIFTIILRDISRRLQMDAELKLHREHLEELVKSRTEELVKINEQLHNDHVIRIEQAKKLAAIEERNRLARDLHDSVTQILFSASLVAEVLPQKWQRDPNEGLSSLNELLLLTRGALAEMRTLLLELRPEAITKIPLGELIAQLTEAVTSRGYLPFELYIENTPPVPEEVQLTFYRVAQEALNNAVKHANAKRVSVSLNFSQLQDPGSESNERWQVKLSIKDDGVGFNTGVLRDERMGLGIMRERAENIGAALEIASQRGEGTRVTLNWQS